MQNKILIVVAHPDDEVLGCFGTVAKMVKQGAEAYTLILSNGKTSRDEFEENEIATLKQEMLEANNVINIKNVFQLDFPDNSFDSVSLLEITKAIEKIKSDIKPNIIFTHHFGDMNIDHQITYQAVLTATRPMCDECVKQIYSMEIPSSTEWNSYNKNNIFVPNVFVDISQTINLKIQAMEKYKSELRAYPHPRSLEFIKELAKTNGIKQGIGYCEQFALVRKVVTMDE